MLTENKVICQINVEENGFEKISENIVGELMEHTQERQHIFGGVVIHHITIRENLNQCLNHIQTYCKPFPKEEDNMTVKIKKEPREVTIEELKEMDEFEKIIIYLNEDKIKEVSERYGLSTCFPSDYKITYTQADLMFKEYYILVDSGMRKISYDFIEKIEVVEF